MPVTGNDMIDDGLIKMTVTSFFFVEIGSPGKFISDMYVPINVYPR